eukprot:gene2668-5247_t
MYNRRVLLERVEKWLSNTYWTDVNIQRYMYEQKSKFDEITVYEPFGEDMPCFEKIRTENRFKPSTIGDSFGPSWSTKWFKLQTRIPIEMHGKRVHILWDSSSEAMIYDNNGHCLQAFTGGDGDDRRDSCLLSISAISGEILTLWVEMACNGMFGNGQGGMIMPPDPNRTFTLNQVELVVINKLIFDLYWDMKVLYDMIQNLPEDHPTASTALSIATSILNTTSLNCKDSILQSRQLINSLFHMNTNSTHNDSAFASSSESKSKSVISNSFKLSHSITAIGHCHIDTAWLWPYNETRRKIKRSWSTQISLMKQYPQYVFVASQSVHWEWIREDCPEVFQELQNLISQKRFIPIGNSYVEFDANIPSGESMIRQLLYGIDFFKNELHMKSDVFWLPDTFGYSGQLPQILKSFQIPYFLSQKLSWNLFNKFPHSTFEWEGIDGSRVIAHFPPADTYNSTANVTEIIKSCNNHKSKLTSNRSLLLFGHGDGGGGPAVSHLEQLSRLQYSDAMPLLSLNSTPSDFFREVQTDHSRSLILHRIPPPVWIGELYLELHQGTLTSQAKIKKQNRQCESVLRGLEALHVLYVVCLFAQSTRNNGGSSRGSSGDDGDDNDGVEVCKKRCKRVNIQVELKLLWKDLLLNQFHDVLPGSSIGRVYEDSDRMLSHVLKRSQELSYVMTSALFAEMSSKQGELLYFNPIGFDRKEILPNGQNIHFHPFTFAMNSTNTGTDNSNSSKDNTANNTTTNTTSSSLLRIQEVGSGSSGTFILENDHLRVVLSNRGGILSMIDKRVVVVSFGEREREGCNGREIIDVGYGIGNDLVLYEDIPFYWDAWDTMPYHLMTGCSINTNTETVNIEEVNSAGNKINDSITSKVKIGQKYCQHSTCSSVIISSNARNEGCVSVQFTHRNWGGKDSDSPNHTSTSTSTSTSSSTESKIPLKEDTEKNSSNGSGDSDSSFIIQTIILRRDSPLLEFETEIEWRENRKLLKVEFPLAIRSSMASYEIQFGMVKRPTHCNNPFDAAMFEVCGHRFTDLSEDNYGVALLNDSKYGHSCRNSTLCMSLLRAPKAPDANCDMGRHHFKYALLPHIGSSLHTGGVIQAAHTFNSPIFGPIPLPRSIPVPPVEEEEVLLENEEYKNSSHVDDIFNNPISEILFEGLLELYTDNSSSSSTLVLDTMKMAEKSNDIILRFYESLGNRGAAKVILNASKINRIQKVFLCNSEEDSLQEIVICSVDNSFLIDYLPFKVITVKLVRGIL